MSKVLTQQNSMGSNTTTTTTAVGKSNTTTKTSPKNGCDSISIDYDDFTTSSSILEFLAQEQQCCSDDVDAESIFQEVSRLADDSDTRSVDEILREAEILIQQQTYFGAGPQNVKQEPTKRAAKQKPKPQQAQQENQQQQQQQLQVHYIKMNTKYMRSIETPPSPSLLNGYCTPLPTSKAVTPSSLVETPSDGGQPFEAFVDNLPSVSVISEESTPKDMFTSSAVGRRLCGGAEEDDDEDATTAQIKYPDGVDGDCDDDTDDATDATIEEITEGMETIELLVNGSDGTSVNGHNANATNETASSSSYASRPLKPPAEHPHVGGAVDGVARRLSYDLHQVHTYGSQPLATALTASPSRRIAMSSPSSSLERSMRRSSMTTTPDSGISNNTPRTHYSPSQSVGVNTSPKRMVSSLTSPIEPMVNVTREHALKHEIELLQEKLKDTEERLQSLRIQHDSLSQLHRDLRESNTHLQEESEMLKLDVQHLNECANILRSELQTARNDRHEAIELQKSLQMDLEENRSDKKRTQEQKDKDTKVIQDLQRQCREMERILMRKHPDSVSALIVASKNSGKCSNNDQENINSRKLLEQRIAQLEADAKEQDHKAQQILANVQARFNSVQSKYETHIADLETQVLSLQEINTKLNEKIESQVRTLDYFVAKKAERFYNNCTQTDQALLVPTAPPPTTTAATLSTGTQTLPTKKPKTRDHSTNTIGSAVNAVSQPHSASSSTSSTANSTPNTSRPNSKQSGIRKPLVSIGGGLSHALASKLPVSQSDSTISAHHQQAKEDAHLLATIRGMRVDLAIKDKAMQRLTRELDECKKTIKKLHREKEAVKTDRSVATGPSTSRRFNPLDPDQIPANTESQALREAQNKIKLLEADYKSLHDKRLQDLKTLQTAHERELASCHETVRILQQRLNERDEAYASQKRRKMPVDYYALKAKVSSLERRHSEREERLHMLVEALSKGRLNGALEELLTDNNNQ